MESINGKPRGELLNGEISRALKAAQIRIEAWRRNENSVRRNSSFCQRPSTAEPISRPELKPVTEMRSLN